MGASLSGNDATPEDLVTKGTDCQIGASLSPEEIPRRRSFRLSVLEFACHTA